MYPECVPQEKHPSSEQLLYAFQSESARIQTLNVDSILSWNCIKSFVQAVQSPLFRGAVDPLLASHIREQRSSVCQHLHSSSSLRIPRFANSERSKPRLCSSPNPLSRRIDTRSSRLATKNYIPQMEGIWATSIESLCDSALRGSNHQRRIKSYIHALRCRGLFKGMPTEMVYTHSASPNNELSNFCCPSESGILIESWPGVRFFHRQSNRSRHVAADEPHLIMYPSTSWSLL